MLRINLRSLEYRSISLWYHYAPAVEKWCYGDFFLPIVTILLNLHMDCSTRHIEFPHYDSGRYFPLSSKVLFSFDNKFRYYLSVFHVQSSFASSYASASAWQASQMPSALASLFPHTEHHAIVSVLLTHWVARFKI